MLELLDAEISSLGCQMLGQALHHDSEIELLILKLDHNPFGTEGLKFLASGLALNKMLKAISLTYCNID